jgi:subtilisin family serine protease
VEQDIFVTTTVPEGVNSLEATKGDEAAANRKRAYCISQALKQNETDGEWGLGRISHLMKFSTPGFGWPTYNYDSKNAYCNGKAFGGGVAYVIDSGVNATHVEFKNTPGGSRAMMGYNADPTWPNTDICGHGTHVRPSTCFISPTIDP